MTYKIEIKTIGGKTHWQGVIDRERLKKLTESADKLSDEAMTNQTPTEDKSISDEKKIILDLCGGTGSWSKPYRDNGYDVRVITLPEFDIREYHPPKNVYGVLSAPPCTMFSLARTTAKTPRDLVGGMELVQECLRIIWEARFENKLAFWALENPKGLLRQFLGNPPLSFDASEFGEGYNKGTDLWGYFKPPRKTQEYHRYASTDKNTRELPPIPDAYVKDENMTNTAIRRSITPQGFAKAFYEANHDN